MAGPFDNPMLPPLEEPTQAPMGGLAQPAQGGLSKFVGDVGRGIQKVMSSPVYEHLWSGMVSYAANDPMAGPMAVQQLRQMYNNSQLQQAELASMQESPAQRAIRESEERAKLYTSRLDEKLRGMSTTDPGYRDVWAARYPAEYGKQAFAEPKTLGPSSYTTEQGVFIQDPAAQGGYRRVGDPYRAPLVSIGGNGFEPTQAAAAEDRSAGNLATDTQKLRDSLDAYDAFTEVYSKIIAEGREASPAETDSLIKMASRVENPEAVQEGDIARKAGGGFENVIRGKAGIGYVLDQKQMTGIAETAARVAAAKRKRLQSLTQSAQGVAADRGLNPTAVGASTGAYGAPMPPADAPAGVKPHPTIPGIWVDPQRPDDWYSN